MRTLLFLTLQALLWAFSLGACKGAKRRTPKEHYRLGKRLYEKRDPSALLQAKAHFQVACEGDVGSACFWLGRLLLEGKGDAQDPEAARAAFDRGCALQVAASCHTLGTWYKRRAEYKAASDAFYLGCVQKNGESCNALGVLYQNGRLGEHDFKTAQKWYQKGCALSFGRACFNLGNTLNDPKGVGGRRREEARTAFLRGCKLKYIEACASAGALDLTLEAGRRNRARGIRLLKKSCSSLPTACFLLSTLYENGGVVPKSEALSRRYATLACQGGLRTACFKYKK